jgi:amino acid transporter
MKPKGHGFGAAPVFLAAISTILGAILFLRFGYAVGHTGLIGSILIIVIGHAITIPTALALAEIETNLKVEKGGEFYIISRSFGSMVGRTIGISLYFSQAISGDNIFPVKAVNLFLSKGSKSSKLVDRPGTYPNFILKCQENSLG